MSQKKIAVVIGSLRKDSFNRKLAARDRASRAGGLHLRACAHRRPAALQPGRRRQPGAAGAAPEERDRGRRRPAVRDAGIQPLDPRRAEERARPRLAALRPERLGRQAGRRGGRVGRRGRHRHRRSSTCATSWPTSTCRRWASPRSSSRTRKACSTTRGIIAEGSKQFLQGWVDKYVAWIKTHTGK